MRRASCHRDSALLVLLAFALVQVGCRRKPPPGADEESSLYLQLESRAGAADPAGSPTEAKSNASQQLARRGKGGGARAPGGALLGSVDDNLPFAPTGKKIASIAWRTWIYTDAGPKRTRLGYLRAGAVVDARGPVIVNDGCAGGWYRINPRGFVCLGKGATDDLAHPVVEQLAQRPIRGEGFPYAYALSGDKSPFRYFRLPTIAQMKKVEGQKVHERGANWRVRAERQGLLERLEITDDLPEFLGPGHALEKPYGTTVHERREVSAGQAGPDSGFALLDAFLWQGRGFGLTTELDMIPLDRTRVVETSQFAGTELAEGESLPVAFHVKGYATLWKKNERGHFEPESEQRERRGFKLTGQESEGMLETTEGFWIAESAMRMVRARTGFPSVATGTRRWIDISIKHQTLVAYVGRQPVYATLVSTGRGGLGAKGDSNPDGHKTVRGTFMIHEKAVSSTMNGDEDRADSYELLDVPFVQYFHRGFALHGAYWHDEFGSKRSHGCVNLAARDAAWLFEWTDPQVPEGWHAALNKERGTVVYVGY